MASQLAFAEVWGHCGLIIKANEVRSVGSQWDPWRESRWWILPHFASGKRLHNYGKSPFSMGKSTISMVIFNSYVKLPEGISRWDWIKLIKLYKTHDLPMFSYEHCLFSSLLRKKIFRRVTTNLGQMMGKIAFVLVNSLVSPWSQLASKPWGTLWQPWRRQDWNGPTWIILGVPSGYVKGWEDVGRMLGGWVRTERLMLPSGYVKIIENGHRNSSFTY